MRQEPSAPRHQPGLASTERARPDIPPYGLNHASLQRIHGRCTPLLSHPATWYGSCPVAKPGVAVGAAKSDVTTSVTAWVARGWFENTRPTRFSSTAPASPLESMS